MPNREELQILLSKQAIQEKIYNYCRAMDRMDNPLGFNIFSEDSIVDYGSHFQGSGRGFVEWANRTHKKVYLATSHQVTNIFIKISSDAMHAVSEAYLHTLQLARPDAGGKYREIHVAGRYLDEWICLDGEWKIRYRRYIQDISEMRECEHPLERFGGMRSHSDPSYALFSSVL